MKIKLFFICIFLILLSLSCVNASEIDNTTIHSIDNTASNNVIGISSDSNLLTGNLNNLQNLINNVEKNGTLVLDEDYSGSSPISIPRSMTIDGNNHVLDGCGECNIFNLASGASITIKNTVFKNCKSDDKGGVIFNEYSSTSLTLVNCQFNNNFADNYGGAVYTEGNLNIEDSSFDSNIADDDDGGAIYCNGNLNIKNSIFKNNKAYRDGGAIICNGQTNVILSQFIDNTAKGAISRCFGGAIRSKGTCTIEQCRFVANYAEDYGGAIYADGNLYIKTIKNDKIYYTEFNENNAENYGGAVYVGGSLYVNWDSPQNDNHHIGIDFGRDVVFNHNTVKEDDGGAVYCCGNTYIKYGSFQRNSAKVDGGAIFCKGETTVKTSEFLSNSASGAKSRCFGGAIRSKGNCIIDGGVFNDNYAEDYGGAVYGDKDVKIYAGASENFMDCNKAENYGGAIYSCGDLYINWNVENPGQFRFEMNKAISDDGGAFYCCGNAYINGANIFENTARVDGGAMFVKGSVNIKNSELTFNSVYSPYSTNNGGAIYAKGKVICENSRLVLNKADNGGAIYTDADVIVKNSSLNSNTAKKGGAIYSDGEVQISNSQFDSNTATKHGGAIYTSTITKVTTSEFIENTAQSDDGGAIYINNKCNPQFISCLFKENICGDEGGAIYLDSSSSHLTLKENIFSKNSANDGNAVFNCGYYDSINHNFWAGKNPSSNNNELVEWQHWPYKNIYHSDSNPLEAVLTYTPSLKDHIVHVTLFFKSGDFNIFDGELCDLNKVSFKATPEMEIKDKNVSTKSVEVDVLPEIGNKYTITANIYGYTTSMILDASKINITAPEITTYYNNTKEFKIHLDGDKYLVANQKIIVTLDSTDYVVFSDENGDARLYFNNYSMNPGTYEILINVGNIYYKSALTIIPNITIVAPSISVYYGGSSKLKIHIDGDKRFAAYQKVKISMLNWNYEVYTDENGDASLFLDNPNQIGTYYISIGVLNIKAYTTLEINSTIEADDIVRVYGDYTPFPATFKNSNGEYLPNCALVQYAIDDSMFMFMNVHGNEGQVLFNIAYLSPGYHWIAIYNLETNEIRYFEIDILP